MGLWMIALDNKKTGSWVNALNKFAIPLIIQFVANYIINLTDQAIVGRISIEAYGAIGIVSSFNYMIAGITGSTTLAFNIRAGNRLSEDKRDEFVHEFISSIWLSTVIGVFFMVFINVFKNFILGGIYSLDGIELDMGLKYFTIVSSYVLIQMLLFTYGQLFKLMNKTKWLLAGSTASALINVFLDYLLVFGKAGFPKLGVEGAAISTVIAMLVNLLILVLAGRKMLKIKWDGFKRYAITGRQQFVESVPLMGQELLEGSVFTLAINSIVARLGILELSSYLILQQILRILLVPANMYSSAVLTLTSQNKSKGFVNLKTIPKVGAGLSTIIYSVMAVMALFMSAILPRIITNDARVIAASSVLIPFMVLCNILMPVQTIFKNALIAIGESKYVLYVSAFISFLVIVTIALMVFQLNIKLEAIFIGSFVNCGSLFGIYYRRYIKTAKRITPVP